MKPLTEREQEVFDKLSEVYDPELDQPLTELDFIEGFAIDSGKVTVSFRLPTYWCSPNFAYMMAYDIRKQVSQLPWVEQVIVLLKDHLASQEINSGIASGKSFSETFPELSDGELDELRRTFQVKSFYARQEHVFRYFLHIGWGEKEVVGFTVEKLQKQVKVDPQGNALLQRYLSKARELGHPMAPEQPAFIQPDGNPIDKDFAKTYLLNARRVRMSMEFNANYCRGLLKTRYQLEESTKPQEETEEVRI